MLIVIFWYSWIWYWNSKLFNKCLKTFDRGHINNYIITSNSVLIGGFYREKKCATLPSIYCMSIFRPANVVNLTVVAIPLSLNFIQPLLNKVGEIWGLYNIIAENSCCSVYQSSQTVLLLFSYTGVAFWHKSNNLFANKTKLWPLHLPWLVLSTW